jgi:hypothetical protein
MAQESSRRELGQYPAGGERIAMEGSVARIGDNIPRLRDDLYGSVPGQQSYRDDDRSGARYGPGSIEDIDQFHVEPAPKPNKVEPKAVVFRPGCTSGSNWNPSKRKDEPDDEQDRGVGIGAPKQVI